MLLNPLVIVYSWVIDTYHDSLDRQSATVILPEPVLTTWEPGILRRWRHGLCCRDNSRKVVELRFSSRQRHTKALYWIRDAVGVVKGENKIPWHSH